MHLQRALDSLGACEGEGSQRWEFQRELLKIRLMLLSACEDVTRQNGSLPNLSAVGVRVAALAAANLLALDAQSLWAVTVLRFVCNTVAAHLDREDSNVSSWELWIRSQFLPCSSQVVTAGYALIPLALRSMTSGARRTEDLLSRLSSTPLPIPRAFFAPRPSVLQVPGSLTLVLWHASSPHMLLIQIAVESESEVRTAGGLVMRRLETGIVLTVHGRFSSQAALPSLSRILRTFAVTLWSCEDADNRSPDSDALLQLDGQVEVPLSTAEGGGAFAAVILWRRPSSTSSRFIVTVRSELRSLDGSMVVPLPPQTLRIFCE